MVQVPQNQQDTLRHPPAHGGLRRGRQRLEGEFVPEDATSVYEAQKAGQQASLFEWRGVRPCDDAQSKAGRRGTRFDFPDNLGQCPQGRHLVRQTMENRMPFQAPEDQRLQPGGTEPEEHWQEFVDDGDSSDRLHTGDHGRLEAKETNQDPAL